jgi:hypothetical protein
MRRHPLAFGSLVLALLANACAVSSEDPLVPDADTTKGVKPSSGDPGADGAPADDAASGDAGDETNAADAAVGPDDTAPAATVDSTVPAVDSGAPAVDSGTAAVDSSVPHDTGAVDSGKADSGAVDSGSPDTGKADSGAGGGDTGTVIPPADAGTVDVTFAIDTTAAVHPISRYVYGTNAGDVNGNAKGVTLTRQGGNRLTAYNWENNASNAGSDYNYQNDSYISASTVSGDPMKQATQTANAAGASILMTVPIAGWVAADTNGPCPSNPSATQIAQRFFPIVAKKGSAFAYPPSKTDGKVYADEFVAWLESQFPSAQTDPARRIFYSLDNEPDLWSSTHSEIHPAAVTYAELTQKNVDFAKAIKDVAPKAIVFGSVNYGWQGYVDLQSAPDAAGRDYLNFYLDTMKAAEATAGKRLVDVLDLHWYPEATGGGVRITDTGTGAAEVDARLQAPRSLWDTTYAETSWVEQWGTAGPIGLIPRLKAKIAAHYPGTQLSFSEYYYGAGGDISGGLAEADVLGVFGREGVFAANVWPMQDAATTTFLWAAFAMYRNYDGAGATFGDTSVQLVDSDVTKTSAFASTNSTGGATVTVVAINKTTSALTAGITLKASSVTTADTYVLTSAAAAPKKGASIAAVGTNAFRYTMPARSVTTLVFKP